MIAMGIMPRPLREKSSLDDLGSTLHLYTY